MTQMLGADPDILDSVAAQCGHAAARFDALRASLGASVQHAPWHGHSADEFRASWNQSYARMLHAAAESLRLMQSALHKNAQQQRQASNAAGGSLGGHAFVGVTIAALRARALGEQRLLQPFLLSAGAGGAGILPGMQKLIAEGKRLDHGWVAEASRDGGAEWHKGREGNTHLGAVPLHGEVGVDAYAVAHAEGSARLSLHGADAAAMASAGVGVAAYASGRAGTQNLGADAAGRVAAEARAQASAKAHVGLDGASASADVKAEAVVSADGHVTAHTGGVDTTLGGHAYAGVGVHGHAEAAVTAREIKASVDVGAALGVGAGVTLSVDVHPAQVIHNIQHLPHPHMPHLGRI